MLRSLKALKGFSMAVADGPAGVLDDVYVDDAVWAVRHLVLRLEETAKLLIPPGLVRRIDWIGRTVILDMEKRDLAARRPIEDDLPVSVRKEREAQRRFAYMACAGVPGACQGGIPYALPSWTLEDPLEETSGDPHLRSAREIIGYRLKAFEGKAGRLIDLLFDEKSWKIPYLGLRFFRRLHPLSTAVPTRFAHDVDWARRAVSIDLARGFVQAGPALPYMPTLEALTAGCRTELEAHFDAPLYGGPEGP